jgi:membrane associated rhomboid family serine protease
VIPIGASVPTRRPPVVTIALVIFCTLVFLYELTLRGAALDAFVGRWGAVPRVVMAALTGDPRVPRIDLVTLITSQFIHAGFLHLGGNMLFLWVFGRAVEDRLGPAIFLPFYLLTGAVAGLVQCWISSTEVVPLIGASGAIAGVLGMYFIAYPTAWVRVLMPVLFFFWTFDLPALLVLAFWFVSQFFNGVTAITQASRATSDVAVWAHVAGFVVGVGANFVLPGRNAVSRAPAGPAVQRDVPGPARLVSSVADLAALLLAARLALRFFGLLGARSVLAFVAVPIGTVTEPFVQPFAVFLPTLRVLGGVLELSTLVAIVIVYLLAGVISQVFLKK